MTKEQRLRRYQIFKIAKILSWLVLVGLVGWVLLNQQVKVDNSATNAQSLAQDVIEACKRGDVLVNGKSICNKAQQVQSEPGSVVAGPQGPQGPEGEPGPRGLQGPQGPAGNNGTDGKPGTAGQQGSPGVQGTQGLAGQAGLNGKDGTPGVNGLDGQPGKDGATGKDGAPGPQGPQGPKGDSISSMTITAADGSKQLCTPVSPGATDFACVLQTPPTEAPSPTGGS